MIDYWLILCPLIQVVLVTIKEYLTEEEQENTLEKDDLQLLKPTKDDPEITAEDDILPKEAWSPGPHTREKCQKPAQCQRLL